jgi:hypothetical protein
MELVNLKHHGDRSTLKGYTKYFYYHGACKPTLSVQTREAFQDRFEEQPVPRTCPRKPQMFYYEILPYNKADAEQCSAAVELLLTASKYEAQTWTKIWLTGQETRKTLGYVTMSDIIGDDLRRSASVKQRHQ